MQVRLLRFRSLEVEGRQYEKDIVIEGGRVRKRKKKPSKPYRDDRDRNGPGIPVRAMSSGDVAGLQLGQSSKEQRAGDRA